MRTLLRSGIAAVALAASAAQGGDLMLPGQDWREVPFEAVDLRPMIRARVGETVGRLMFDIGTPDEIFLNREAVALDAGEAGTSGTTASGQSVTTRVHTAPEVTIADAPFDAPDRVRSGPFGFAEEGLGHDFLGFIGAPAVAESAFALDYRRGVLTLFRVEDDGSLAVPPPDLGDVVARLAFAWEPGGLPTAAAALGAVPTLLDLDTGDRGTIYLRPETRTALESAGVVRQAEAGTLVADITLGGTTFTAVPLRHVVAGGPEDFRRARAPDLVRLGAEFFSRHPVLWNFPAGTATVLRPDSAFLAPR